MVLEVSLESDLLTAGEVRMHNTFECLHNDVHLHLTQHETAC
jgi:hypothetical protein